MISAVAIVCIRNEAVHVLRCLTDLIDAGLSVYLIDNQSTDDSVEIAREFLGRGLIAIANLPWRGAFSLSDQLRAKREIVSRVNHDWVVHADADEWLCSPIEGQSLIEGIIAADSSGYNCINFHEIVFVPLPDDNFESSDYASRMDRYYFFQPSYPRLNRAWKRNAGLDALHSGGHILSGQALMLSPTDFLLRHYIVLSEAHARRKYVGRLFSEEDCGKNWHATRRMIEPERLAVKQNAALKRTNDPSKHVFDLSSPVRKHFWFW